MQSKLYKISKKKITSYKNPWAFKIFVKFYCKIKYLFNKIIKKCRFIALKIKVNKISEIKYLIEHKIEV